MEQKKIDELKKLMGFGFLIVDSEKKAKYVQELMGVRSYNDLVPLLVRLAVGYDLEYDENQLSEMFNEPQTTETLEQAYQEYMEYKRVEQGE
jgi:hypothetical protein